MKLLSAATVLAAVACSLSMANDVQLAPFLNDFSVSLFSHLWTENADRNVFASPFSVSTAMAMVLLGARGKTAEQVRNSLKLYGLVADQDDVHQRFSEVSILLASVCKTEARPLIISHHHRNSC